MFSEVFQNVELKIDDGEKSRRAIFNNTTIIVWK
jgi:hypothetical protein